MFKKFSVALLVATFVCATPAFSSESAPAVEVSTTYATRAKNVVSAGFTNIANAASAVGTGTKNTAAAVGNKVKSGASYVATKTVQTKDVSVDLAKKAWTFVSQTHPVVSATVLCLGASALLLYNRAAIKAKARSVLGFSEDTSCTCDYSEQA